MIEIKTFCDKCKKEINRRDSMYVLSHEPVTQGYAIMGDNRVVEPLNFCRDCFYIIYNLALKQ